MYKPTGRTLTVDDITLIEVICDECRRTKFCSENSEYSASRCFVCEIKESAKNRDKEIESLSWESTTHTTPELQAKTVGDLVDHLRKLEDWDTKDVCILPREYGDVIQVTDRKRDGKEIVLIHIGQTETQ